MKDCELTKRGICRIVTVGASSSAAARYGCRRKLVGGDERKRLRGAYTNYHTRIGRLLGCYLSATAVEKRPMNQFDFRVEFVSCVLVVSTTKQGQCN